MSCNFFVTINLQSKVDIHRREQSDHQNGCQPNGNQQFQKREAMFSFGKLSRLVFHSHHGVLPVDDELLDDELSDVDAAAERAASMNS